MATLLHNCINISQSAAELLLFVQKSKMAAAAILDFIFVQYYGISVFYVFNKLSPRAKLRADICNNKRGIGDKQNLRWRSLDSFFVVASYKLAKLH